MSPAGFSAAIGLRGNRRRFALYCKAGGLIPHRIRNSFCGGERRPSGEEGISMYVSYADVFQFALVLFVPAPFGKQKNSRPQPKVCGYFLAKITEG